MQYKEDQPLSENEFAQKPHFVEIEVSSYCNRTCAWCPNDYSNRGRVKSFMTDETWRKIIRGLVEIDYQGWLAFHNYNEPLADPSIFQKIAFVNEQLPVAKTAVYTNGDYLNEETTGKLITLETNEIRITLYPRNGEAFLPPDDDRISSMIRRMNLDIDEPQITDGKRGKEATVQISKTTFHFIVPSIKGYTNRAGSVGLGELNELQERTTPCFLPIHSAAIDYHGNLKLCCQIYDVTSKEDSGYNIGNVNDSSFWDLWSSEKMAAFRRNAMLAKFDLMPACRKCAHQISNHQSENLSRSQ